VADLTKSRFADDFKAILAGIENDIRAAWPDVLKVHADRNVIEDPTTPRAVIVPDGVTMISGGSDPASSGIKTVLQQFRFSIFLIDRMTPNQDVIAVKVDRADLLIEQLMESRQYIGVYELPQVTRVELAEQEPDPRYSILQIDFECQTLNWKHEAA
jgi:hypothetical protein